MKKLEDFEDVRQYKAEGIKRFEDFWIGYVQALSSIQLVAVWMNDFLFDWSDYCEAVCHWRATSQAKKAHRMRLRFNVSSLTNSFGDYVYDLGAKAALKANKSAGRILDRFIDAIESDKWQLFDHLFTEKCTRYTASIWKH